MNDDMIKKLLKDKRVIEEIHRHLWIESEKAGYDIGFDKASEDWMKHFAKAWMDYHMPAWNAPQKKSIFFSKKILAKDSSA